MLDTNNLYSQVRKFLIILVAIVFFVSVVFPNIASAKLSDEQKSVYGKGIYYFDVGCSAEGVNEELSNPGGSVFVVGDSIVEGAKTELEEEFSEKTIQTTGIDGAVSRSLSSPGRGTQSGLQVIDSKTTEISESDNIVVALGTNGEGSASQFKTRAESAVEKIKAANSNANIYWVKIFSTADRISHKNSYNDAIDSLGVKVIDPNGKGIALSDGVHPKPEGKKEYAKVIADALESPSASASSVDLSELSLREKIAQMMFVGATGSKEDTLEIVEKHKVGGIMITSESTWLYSESAIKELKEASETPLLIASDEEGGKVQRLKGQTGAFPSAKELGSKSAGEIKTIAKEYGEKLAGLGVTVNYAPVLDIDNGSNPIISDTYRAFSNNSAAVTEKAKAFAEGMREAGVTPVFKHFPGHGSASGDSHNERVVTPHINSLKQRDLKPYETLLKEPKSGVMVGHLVVPGLTAGDRNEQTSINKGAIDMLRDDFEFNQVVFTDEIANMKAITNKYAPAEAVALSIRAGVDMPLFNYNGSKFSSIDEQVSKTISKVQQDVNNNKIDKKDIDASINRIAEIKGDTPKPETRIAGNCECQQNGGEVSEVTGGTNAHKAYNYLIGKGLSAKAASAVVGNFMLESGGNTENISTTIEAPSTGAHGIGQWAFGRKTKLYEMGGETDLLKQLDYFWWEVSTPEGQAFSGTQPPYALYGGPMNDKKLIDILKSDLGLAEMTIAFEQIFERSGVLGQRVQNAQEILDKYGGGGGGGSEPSAVNLCENPGGGGETSGELIWPVDQQYPLTSCWNEYRSYYNNGAGGGHSGIDISTPRGVKVVAADGGTVELAADRGRAGYGKVVMIKHSNGKWTLYGHLDTIKVSQGEKVSQNQQIGTTDNSGASRGEHLHFNVQDKAGEQGVAAQTLNPLDYLPEDGRNLSTNKGKCGKGESGYE